MVCRDQRLATGFGDNVVMFIIHDDDVHTLLQKSFVGAG